jgi:predicted GNAT family acetyltransferase
VTEISWIVVAEDYRRRAIASSLLTAQALDVFTWGEIAAYYAGEASEHLDHMLTRLGFSEVQES